MNICPRLESILNDRDHEIYVVVTNVLSEKDKKLLREHGMRQSVKDGDKVFVGNLKPSQINDLVSKIDHRAKIEVEPAVPRSQH